MMQYLTAAKEVNSWHTLLALFIVVFVLLAIFFFRTVFGTEKKEEDATAPVPTPRAVIPTPTSVAEDAQLVAVITAAVAAAMAEENGGKAPAFRVVSFRRI